MEDAVHNSTVTWDYFSTMKIPVISGRGFAETESANRATRAMLDRRIRFIFILLLNETPILLFCFGNHA